MNHLFILNPIEVLRRVDALSEAEALELYAYTRPYENKPHEFVLHASAWLLNHDETRRPD